MTDSKTIRDSGFYCSWQTRLMLNDIARAKGVPADELAEEYLADRIKADFPQVVAHHKELVESKAVFAKQLAATIGPKLPI